MMGKRMGHGGRGDEAKSTKMIKKDGTKRRTKLQVKKVRGHKHQHSMRSRERGRRNDGQNMRPNAERINHKIPRRHNGGRGGAGDEMIGQKYMGSEAEGKKPRTLRRHEREGRL